MKMKMKIWMKMFIMKIFLNFLRRVFFWFFCYRYILIQRDRKKKCMRSNIT